MDSFLVWAGIPYLPFLDKRWKVCLLQDHLFLLYLILQYILIHEWLPFLNDILYCNMPDGKRLGIESVYAIAEGSVLDDWDSLWELHCKWTAGEGLYSIPRMVLSNPWLCDGDRWSPQRSWAYEMVHAWEHPQSVIQGNRIDDLCSTLWRGGCLVCCSCWLDNLSCYMSRRVF